MSVCIPGQEKDSPEIQNFEQLYFLALFDCRQNNSTVMNNFFKTWKFIVFFFTRISILTQFHTPTDINVDR